MLKLKISPRRCLTVSVAVAALAVLLVAGSAFARNHGYGGGSGSGWNGCQGDYRGGPWGGGQYEALTPEKREQLNEIMTRHFDRVQPLRDQMWARSMELDALSQNPNTTPEQISELVQDMADLRAQMFKEHENLRATIEKETGMSGFGPGRGYGAYGGYGGYGDCGGYGGGFWSNGHRGNGRGWGRR